MKRPAPLWQRLRRLPADERGQLLALTLIATVVGVLVIAGFLSYAASSLFLTRDTGDEVHIRYTTDAGVEAVLADLSQGVNVLAPGYAVVQNGVSLNGYTATVAVTEVTTNTTVASQYRYLDPGVPDLDPGFYITYDLNTETGTNIYVNMPFTPITASWKIILFDQGDTIDCVNPDPSVPVDSGSSSPARFVAQPAPGSGPHTLAFCNMEVSTPTITPAPYGSTGITTTTWVWANAYRDFLITSTVGGLSLRANARQMPGTDVYPQTAIVTSWHWEH